MGSLRLTRKDGESIYLGDGDGGTPVVRVTVVRVGRGRVQIVVTAPEDVDVLRGELLGAVERIRRDRLAEGRA